MQMGYGLKSAKYLALGNGTRQTRALTSSYRRRVDLLIVRVMNRYASSRAPVIAASCGHDSGHTVNETMKSEDLFGISRPID